ncbi:UNKNOWN [Stylonychia lemnae]|uniref:Uncharacterized protein n=1 Tax=Stylonychia lemnae TaxID=5949 RepID=A0A078A6E3_STYLE|nr:UNKNOWN [Stylonychia lemnae]|eukprot:CDW77436.1 UNKNOWN [Stylonychia lemnae]
MINEEIEFSDQLDQMQQNVDDSLRYQLRRRISDNYMQSNYHQLTFQTQNLKLSSDSNLDIITQGKIQNKNQSSNDMKQQLLESEMLENFYLTSYLTHNKVLCQFQGKQSNHDNKTPSINENIHFAKVSNEILESRIFYPNQRHLSTFSLPFDDILTHGTSNKYCNSKDHIFNDLYNSDIYFQSQENGTQINDDQVKDRFSHQDFTRDIIKNSSNCDSQDNFQQQMKKENFQKILNPSSSHHVDHQKVPFKMRKRHMIKKSDQNQITRKQDIRKLSKELKKLQVSSKLRHKLLAKDYSQE